MGRGGAWGRLLFTPPSPRPQLPTLIHVLLGSSAGHLGIESWSCRTIWGTLSRETGSKSRDVPTFQILTTLGGDETQRI